MSRRAERGRGQDQPVRDDDRRIDPEGAELAHRGGIETRGRRHREGPRERRLVDRRSARAVAAAGRPGRLCVDADDGVPGVEQRHQTRHREFGRTHEGEWQTGHAASGGHFGQPPYLGQLAQNDAPFDRRQVIDEQLSG